MEVRLMQADARVREDIGKAAVTRGPIVYCMEEADNGKTFSCILLRRIPNLRLYKEEKIGQRMVTITTKGEKTGAAGEEEDGELYREYKKPVYEDVLLQWIPYYAWANRGEGEMQVFIKTNR